MLYTAQRGGGAPPVVPNNSETGSLGLVHRISYEGGET